MATLEQIMQAKSPQDVMALGGRQTTNLPPALEERIFRKRGSRIQAAKKQRQEHACNCRKKECSVTYVVIGGQEKHQHTSFLNLCAQLRNRFQVELFAHSSVSDYRRLESGLPDAGKELLQLAQVVAVSFLPWTAIRHTDIKEMTFDAGEKKAYITFDAQFTWYELSVTGSLAKR
ncbi:MAG: hypothetical protein A2754_01520 [Candidatus Magasanikbacteria bacterium RIFCSPHIGHO2_01_FULL_47_8]|uniref:Uncharacterized protein n=1 Tax=Candidatus Magasanikbacteria bacterium RIFCSPHIGHO2_01_FULL_47_8 TaxID=1798673 RepID=A0A1F6MC41_9BACT|nr:MAG: hypothetical protein A2754_01520 [Candidatus Magasanikbacteria bacterium RIFCSPHIGHO2_01_FULL_47_8]